MALGEAERRLLLSILDIREPLRFPVEAGQPLDWLAVVRAARRGMILPLLAQRVLAETACGRDAEAARRAFGADPAIADQLRESLQQTAAYNTRLLAELARCVSTLQAEGIRSVVLKGAALMLRDYPHRSMRYAIDFDLLIDPDRFQQALAVLEPEGYHLPEQLLNPGPDGRRIADTMLALADGYAWAPLRGPSGVNADLHYRVPGAAFASSGGFAGWLERSEPLQVHGVQVDLCSRVDLAAHLCEHVAGQNHWEPDQLPRLLCDLRALFPDGVPWRRLRSPSAGQKAFLWTVRVIYDAVFERPEADDAPSRLVRRLAVLDPAVALPLAELSNLWAHASRIAYDIANRPEYAVRTWIPSRAYLAWRYGLQPDSPRIYPIYLSRFWKAALKPLLRREP